MLREIIKPKQTNLTITIPTSYLNREIESIMLPLDGPIIQESKPKKKKSLRGVFNQYADSSKVALEESAWKNHIVDKFKND